MITVAEPPPVEPGGYLRWLTPLGDIIPRWTARGDVIAIDDVICGEYSLERAKAFAIGILSAVDLMEREASERDAN